MRWVRNRVICGFGVIAISFPKPKKKVKGPDQVLDSYVSLCNNFADRMRSTVVSQKKNEENKSRSRYNVEGSFL